MAGMVLGGRYRLEAPLGSGGMAEVFRAVDERLGRRVAVKLLHPRALPPERERFFLEVRALSRLFHPGIVQVLDLGEEEGRPYFVMELVEGGTFDRLGPFEEGPEGERILRAAQMVMEALAHLHAQGILHRDLTPKNILLTREGYPKVMDLGGEATLVQAAMEPEVEDLGRFLGMLGVEVRGLGSAILHVRGAARLGGGTYRIIPDRIEAGTYLLAAAATRGELTLSGVRPDHLDALLDKLRQAGHRVEVGEDWVRFTATPNPEPFHVEAREYPGFPTDLQPIVTAYLATVPGQSTVTDRVYPDRFTHVGELARMGAELYLRDRTLLVSGKRLRGAQVKALDIRAGGSLVVAALSAEGVSEIEGVYFLERGYEDLGERLRALGARVGLEETALALAAD